MEIYAVTSGQEGVFASRLALYSEMEDKYPGLLTILRDPYGSLYLHEGMYEMAIRFLEDRMNIHGGELFLPTIYDKNNLEGELIQAVLDRLLPYCETDEATRLLNGLETAGVRNGMDKVAGWDPLTLNMAMIEMLREDCKDTADKIENNPFTEENKVFLTVLADGISQYAYSVVVYLSMAQYTAKYAEGEGGSGTAQAQYGDDFGKMGTYVENPNIEVDWTQATAHGTERLQQRGMTQEMVNNIVENGKVLS